MSVEKEWAFAAIPLFLGGCFFTMGFRSIRRAHVLRRSGTKAYGYIVGHAPHSGGNTSITVGGKGMPAYHPIVAWTTSTGVLQQQTSDVGRTWIGAFPVGTRVLVYYDPRDPDRWVMEGYGHATPWLCAAFGAVLLLGTAAVVAAALWWNLTHS
ncbi:DUF3592 domain-containing protein [Streptomyces sp. BB1-1-1]|uniref:DUF3592 domain-containing protein n=1 Tax=unclassified Streptomyces TaxID=2593676 RepID=UPI002877ADEB|nr:DUF3592 domain-containing protein [Streptomyces sp. BB1-1-1]WND39210.1 DUF3592 domain-containing protein [Streptomyces sp. BB1-1-1]